MPNWFFLIALHVEDGENEMTLRFGQDLFFTIFVTAAAAAIAAHHTFVVVVAAANMQYFIL